ncbi:MAG: tyrosine--tRNA ligase [Candidatus Thermoplasmatota archaeon]
MSADDKLALLLRNAQEVITIEEAQALLEKAGAKRAYVGFEPSGLFHIGQGVVVGQKIKDLSSLGFDLTVLLADWHAFINDKWGRDMEKIRVCGEYMRDCLLALGVEEEKVRFMYASELVSSSSYWERVIRISKASTVARIKRALTIMGRKESDADADASKLIYPAMQAADIFHLELDLALGGMDQRHAHMLAREVSERLGWRRFVALHTPLLISLRGGGRMDAADLKMSKSVPESCIFVHDAPEEIARKIEGAYCPPKVGEGNPVLDHCRLIIFPMMGRMEIERPERYGGSLSFESYEALESAYKEGRLHPADLKAATAHYLSAVLEGARAYLRRHHENLDKVLGMVSG